MVEGGQFSKVYHLMKFFYFFVIFFKTCFLVVVEYVKYYVKN